MDINNLVSYHLYRAKVKYLGISHGEKAFLLKCKGA